MMVHRKGADTKHVFFFQAEDGIRDTSVTGVQTCALPILSIRLKPLSHSASRLRLSGRSGHSLYDCTVVGRTLGASAHDADVVRRTTTDRRASCRERV